MPKPTFKPVSISRDHLNPAQPLILTLLLDTATEAHLTILRTKYFPPARNYLSAHVTLFHALPADARTLIEEDLVDLSARTAAYGVWCGPPFAMGLGGVGVEVREAKTRKERAERAKDMTMELHRRLLQRWRSRGVAMTAQDQQTLKCPHITVQVS